MTLKLKPTDYVLDMAEDLAQAWPGLDEKEQKVFAVMIFLTGIFEDAVATAEDGELKVIGG